MLRRFKHLPVPIATCLLLVAGSATADPVLVEYRSLDGTPLAAAGDAVSSPGRRDAGSARQRVAARAAAIARAREELLASLPGRLGQLVRHAYVHFPLLRMDVDDAARRELSANLRVVAVHDDRLRRPLTQSSLAYVGAARWHAEGNLGQGTSVAVLDTGIRYWNGSFGTCDEPGDEGCRVVVFEGFATLEFGTGTTDPIEVAEAEGHGTNVGGIVGAVAPATDLLSLGVFALYDPDPSTGFDGGVLSSDGDVAAALDWVVEHQAEYAIVAANMSLGSEGDPDARGFCAGYMAGAYPPVFANCREAGVLPVVATGNEYLKTAVDPPACVASAVRAGAGYDDPAFGYSCGTGPVVPGAVACFSNSSSLVDFVAPGVDIDAGGEYGYSGTSMAAPHVAGLAAVYQARYGTDPFWTLERMRADAVPVTEDFPEQPYVHRYVRLGDRDALLHFDAGAVLVSDFEGLEIPDGESPGVEVSAEVVCEDLSCASDHVGRVYVDLTIDHTATGDLVLELEAPDGTTARHEVAGDEEFGKYNVNSIVGSQHVPDAFAALANAPIAGTWTLRVQDDTAGGFGFLHKAALLIDSARVQLDAQLVAPAIARPGEPFDVEVSIANRGNLEVTAAPLRLELVAREDGAVADSADVALALPSAPGDAFAGTFRLTGAAEGVYDVRLATDGLTPDLLPGLVVEPQEVSVTRRTFAAFDVDPRVPTPGEEARLVDWSVGLIDSRAWEFGDGGTSAEAAPAHAWTAAGDYVVTLTVTGPDGTSTAIRTVHVDEPPPLPPPPHVVVAPTGCSCGMAGTGRTPWTAIAALLGALCLFGALSRERKRERERERERARARPSSSMAIEREHDHVRVHVHDHVHDPAGRGPGLRGGPSSGSGRLARLVALPLVLACPPGTGCDGTHPTIDGGPDTPPDSGYAYGPWVSLLDPASPAEGDIDIHVRLGHEASLPCDLAVEYAVGESDFRPTTLDEDDEVTGLATTSAAGVEYELRWRSTVDLPGDTPDVRIRVTATDGERDSSPVVSSTFLLLNFLVTHPHAVLITEVSTADRNVPGRMRDDYVELLNTTTEDLALDGWKMLVAGSSGVRDEFPLDGVVLPAGGRLSLVEAGAEYAGGRPLERELPWGIEGYGSVAVVATYERGVDFARWGGSPEVPPAGLAWTDDPPLPVPQTLTVLNRADESADDDRASDFCMSRPSPDEASAGCLPRGTRGDLLVTELDSQGADDQFEVLNRSGEPVNTGGWVLLWDGDDLGSGEIPLAGCDLEDGARLGLRDNGIPGRIVGGVMELGVNVNIDGLVPVAVGVKDPYGEVVDFLAAGGSTVRWLDWGDGPPTPMPGPRTTLSRRPGDPDTDGPADFCLTEPNITDPPTACLEPLGTELRISEVQAGRPDWVELYNPGPEPVDLSRVYLSYSSPNYGGSVEDFPLSGTLEPGALAVVSERDLADVTGEILIDGNMAVATDGNASVALRDEWGFGIDFVMWGEPAGTPLWPDTWSGLGADPNPEDSDWKSIERQPHDAADTNTRDDWCWAEPTPGAPNAACDP